jgi:Tfp pilus assembly protein PilF
MDEAERTLRSKLAASVEYRLAWLECATAPPEPDWAKAKAWIEIASSSAPANSLVDTIALARAWGHFGAARSSNRVEEARAALQTADDLRRRANALSANSDPPPRREVILELIGLNEGADDLDSLERDYRSLLKTDPTDRILQNNLAMTLVRRNERLEEALELARAAASEPGPLQARFQETLATAQARLRRFDEAESTLRTALRAQPANLAWRIHLAEILIDGGDSRKARLALDEAVKLVEGNEKTSATLLERIESARRKVAAMARG